jgi:imidazolonepropionase-like amidohydrolase
MSTRQLASILSLLVATTTGCPNADDTADEGETGDTGDTGDTGGTIVECGALEAPDAGTCTAEGQAGGSLLIRGDVLAPDAVYRGGSVRIEAGAITCVGCECDAADATLTCADAVISPGLINPHDHITFANNWPIGEGVDRYDHRHDWRKGLNGHATLPTQSGASNANILAAELRFVIAGATSTASAGGQPGLLRNLDSGQLEGLSIPQADSDTFPLDDNDGTQQSNGCNYGGSPTTGQSIQGSAYLPHIAEGINLYASNELVCTSSGANDVVESNTAIVHAVGVPLALAQQIVSANAKVIWSPRSNIVLYGATAPVTMFDTLGIPIALGTDWIASGSMNMLRELACAAYLDDTHYGDYFSDRDLWQMATSGGALAVGGELAIGELSVGWIADVAIFAKQGETDHGAIVRGHESKVALVLRGGEPLYGDAALLGSGALGSDGCETLDVCGVAKRACVAQDTGMSLSAVEAAAGYPLFFCGVPDDEPSCVPSRDEYPDGPTASDQDGDGIPDELDNCPSVFNPVFGVPFPLWEDQPDTDLDGFGDVCDPCPFNEGDVCEGPDPDDSDGDGVSNDADNCPLDANPDQADADNDGKGDACDDCPVANPGNQACPATVEQIQDPSDPGHLPPGATVLVSGLTVTAIRPDAAAFAAETGTGQPYTGIFVFTGGNPNGLVIGDIVDVQGTIEEYFDLTELVDTQVTIVTPGDGTLPFAAKLFDPAEITTGGAQAEPHESMLVQVANVVITNVNPDDAMDYDEFEVSGLRVDDLFFESLDNMCALDSSFTSLTGVLIESFSNFKLTPRGAGDFEFGVPMCVPFP